MSLEFPVWGKLDCPCDYVTEEGTSQTEPETLFLSDSKTFLKDKEGRGRPAWAALAWWPPWMVNHPKSDKGLLCSSWFKDQGRPTTWSSSGRDEERVPEGCSCCTWFLWPRGSPVWKRLPSKESRLETQLPHGLWDFKFLLKSKASFWDFIFSFWS